MKKLILSVLLILGVFAVACSNTSVSALQPERVDANLKASVLKTMQARGINADVQVERLQTLSKPQGFHFYKVTIKDLDRDIIQDQYLFSDGNVIAADFIDIDSGANISRDLMFELSTVDLDTSRLTLMHGNPNAANKIIEITDFDCPYCRRANAYITDKISNRDDVAVYIAHFPLRIHPNAETKARIFEAGVMMDQNFSQELFTNEQLDGLSQEDLAQYFAEKSGDAEKFYSLLSSEQVNNILAYDFQLASQLGVNATPVIFINGKKVEGFDAALIDRAIGTF